MAEHVWTILCTKASIDAQTNTISLFEVVEQLTIEVEGEEPDEFFAQTQLNLVTLVERSDSNQPEVANGKAQLLAPDGAELGTGEWEANLTEAVRNRNVGRLRGIPVRGSGRYCFVMWLQSVGEEWKQVARVPLFVTVKTSVGLSDPDVDS